MHRIERYLRARFYQSGEPIMSVNNNPIVKVQINCRMRSETLQLFKDLLERRKESRDIAISPLTPDGHNIDPVLRLWKDAGVIESFDTTKSGFYVVFINDGAP